MSPSKITLLVSSFACGNRALRLSASAFWPEADERNDTVKTVIRQKSEYLTGEYI